MSEQEAGLHHSAGDSNEGNRPQYRQKDSLSSERATRPQELPVWTRHVVSMAIIASFGGLIFGYGGIGQIGGFLAMQDYRNRFGNITEDGIKNISDTRQGTIVGLMMIGALIGSLVAGRISDRTGRKKSITFWCIIFLAGLIIEIASMHWYGQVVIARTIEGLGVGALSILVPMYEGEIAPKEARGTIIAMYQLFITLGILLASIVNLGTKHIPNSGSWRITIGIGMLWPIVLAVGIQFLDESPRWVLRQGYSERASRTLAKMHNTHPLHFYIQAEIHDIEQSVRTELALEKPSMISLFKEPTILRRFFIGMVVQALQQLTGINYFFYYGTILFSDLDVGDSFVTAVILGAVNLFATFGGLWIAARFSHRMALIFGALWIGVWLLFYAFFGWFSIMKSPSNPSAVGKSMIFYTCMAIVGFATTWGPLAWVVCAEIFSPRWKSAGMGVATATNWTFNFLIAFFTTKITSAIGYGLGWVFAGAILVGAVFTYFFVPETAYKSLEAIDKEILNGIKPWYSKKGRREHDSTS